MANTYVQIGSTVTVGSGGAASIDFTSIPATYTDLVVKMSGRTTYSGGGTAYSTFTFNGNTANYSTKNLQGNGATVVSTNNSGGTGLMYFGNIPGTTYTANTFASYEIYIPNYASANNKSVSIDSVTENNATTSYANLVAGLWANSAAITSISFKPEVGTGDWSQYSTATLYGIKKD
jgi:hypothetical protein